MRTTLPFSHKVHCCHSQKDGKGLKTATPQGLFSSPFSPSFPSPPSSSDPSLPSKELLRAPPPWSRGLELRTPPSWEEKLVALEVGHGGLVHSDVDWMGPPGKRNWLHTSAPPPTLALHNPTPRTGTKNRFVPCMNSSLLFILVSGSRCAILTPSSAFLLCALAKNCTTSILKCENIGTDITPPCFSWMCFQRGLLPLFLSTSSTY